MASDYFSVKGFISYGALTNNEPNVVSPIGELSLHSGTFAKDRHHYYQPTTTTPPTTAEVTVFTCQDATGTNQPMPAPYMAFLKEVADWCYRASLDGTLNGLTDSFRTAFTDEFGAAIENLTIGAMVTNGTLWLPSYITVYVNPDELWGGNAPSSMNPTRFRLWFSDTAFRQQYDDYSLVFIPPVDDLDSLFGAAHVVVKQLELRTPPELTMLIQEAAANKPYTVLRSMNFRYHYKGSPQQTAPAYWTFLIWGEFGDNVDTLKAKLADWILANSEHSREEWAEIFPDIFTSTEFVITPLWNQYAIPNLTLDHAMYSPTVSLSDASLFARATGCGTGYTDTHVDTHASFLSMPFKSIACLAVGGPENRDAQYSLVDVRPDYIAVPPSSIDFDRMSQSTRGWAYKMFSMLAVAETMGEFTDVPAGMSRLKRTNRDGDEILYVVSNFEDIQYLVVSKYSLNTLYPPVDRSANPIVFSPDPSVTLTTPDGSKRLQLNVSVTGGTAPYSYTASSGDIETGGQIDPATGYLDVTFREWGSNSIDVTVTDAKGFPSTAHYTVVSNQSAGT